MNFDKKLWEKNYRPYKILSSSIHWEYADMVENEEESSKNV